MKHLLEQTDAYRVARHPGAKLGDFLIAHSNSPEYLVAVLQRFLTAAQADLAADRASIETLVAAAKKEQPGA